MTRGPLKPIFDPTNTHAHVLVSPFFFLSPQKLVLGTKHFETAKLGAPPNFWVRVLDTTTILESRPLSPLVLFAQTAACCEFSRRPQQGRILPLAAVYIPCSCFKLQEPCASATESKQFFLRFSVRPELLFSSREIILRSVLRR